MSQIKNKSEEFVIDLGDKKCFPYFFYFWWFHPMNNTEEASSSDFCNDPKNKKYMYMMFFDLLFWNKQKDKKVISINISFLPRDSSSAIG